MKNKFLLQFLLVKSFKNTNITIDDIDCIVSASAVGIQPIPCMAALIHEKIAKGTSIPALDINTTCTSFITALDTMSYLLDSGRYKRILIVSCDVAQEHWTLNKRKFSTLQWWCSSLYYWKPMKKLVLLMLHKNLVRRSSFNWNCGGLSNFHPENYSESTKEEFMFDMCGKTILALSMKKFLKWWKNF